MKGLLIRSFERAARRLGGAEAAERGRERGVALILVLWVVVLLAVVAAGFASQARLQTDLTRNARSAAEARHLADAGVEFAARRLLDRVEPIGPDFGFACAFGGGVVTVSVQDEHGKLSLNEAPEPLLRALLEAAGMSEEAASRLAAAIADYRDADDLARPGGAEVDAYRAAGLPPPKNAPFEALEELEAVLGAPPGTRREAARRGDALLLSPRCRRGGRRASGAEGVLRARAGGGVGGAGGRRAERRDRL